MGPGEAFGQQGRGRVRLSLASAQEQVRREVRALAAACAELAEGAVPG